MPLVVRCIGWGRSLSLSVLFVSTQNFIIPFLDRVPACNIYVKSPNSTRIVLLKKTFFIDIAGVRFGASTPKFKEKVIRRKAAPNQELKGLHES